MSFRGNAKALLRLLIVGILALSLFSCKSGSGGGGGGGPISTVISGIAAAGLVVGGTVTAYPVSGGAKALPALGSTTTDGNGAYAIELGSYTGLALLELQGGTFIDEATGTQIPLAMTLRSAVFANGATSANITPFTEAALVNASGSPGGLTLTNITSAHSSILSLLGFNPIGTVPVIATSAAASSALNASRAYGAYLAGFSQYLLDNPTKTMSSAISDYALAFVAGGLQNFPAITTSQNAFLSRNSNNQTGLATYAALQALNPTSSRQLTSISLNPSAISLPSSGAKQLTATGTYSDTTQSDITGRVTWSSSAATVASVNASGLVLGVASGTSTITASLGTVSTTLAATVTPVTLKSLSVSPGARIGVGGSTQLLATATYSDGTTGDLTSNVTWTSATPQIATVSASGVATGVSAGTGSIAATLGAVSNTISVPVAVPKFAFVTNFFSNSLAAYSIDASSGALTSVQTVATGSGPVAVAVDPTGRFAFSANNGSNNISEFSVDSASGTLTTVATVPAGTSPSSIAIDRAGTHVYVANRDASSVSSYSLDPASGALTAGPVLSTNVSGPTSLAVDPSGRLLYVLNGNTNTVDVYNIAPATGALTRNASLGTTTTSSPLSIVLHPAGKFAYVALSATGIMEFAVDPGPGATMGALSNGKTILSGSVMAVDPAGKFLFSAGSQLNAVFAYSINPATGNVEGGSFVTTATNPTALNVDLTGHFLYVVSAPGNSISTYSINQASGALTLVQSVATGSSPQGLTSD